MAAQSLIIMIMMMIISCDHCHCGNWMCHLIWDMSWPCLHSGVTHRRTTGHTRDLIHRPHSCDMGLHVRDSTSPLCHLLCSTASHVHYIRLKMTQQVVVIILLTIVHCAKGRKLVNLRSVCIPFVDFPHGSKWHQAIVFLKTNAEIEHSLLCLYVLALNHRM